jgi:hypothetical protein
MRPLSISEIILFARVLMLHPARARPRLARQLLAEVELAARRFRATAEVDPQFGDGSLMARCLLVSPPGRVMADDPDFLRSLATACRALLGHSRP